MEANIAVPPTAAQSARCRVLACSGSLDGGGSERQLWQLVTHLDRQRFAPEVYLLYRRGPYLAQLPADVPVHAFDNQHPAPATFPPGRVSWLQARHLRALVQAQQIDVVYDRTYHMTLVTGSLPRAVPRISVIVSPPSRDLAQNENRLRWLKRHLLARAYRKAACTICVSQEVADDAATYYGLPTHRFTVLNSPVDIEAIEQKARAPLPPALGELFQSRNGHLHVALVGRFTAEKGHAFAVQLAADWRTSQGASSQPLHLHFIGSGPLEADIRDRVRSLQLDASIHFHGYQTNPYSLLKACNLALIPSRYEGFPNVALEAMALGIPVLMTRYGTTAEQLAGPAQERAALIELDDVAGALRALTDLADQPQAWQARADRAQDWVTSTHAMTPWLDRMSDLLLQHARRRAA